MTIALAIASILTVGGILILPNKRVQDRFILGGTCLACAAFLFAVLGGLIPFYPE